MVGLEVQLHDPVMLLQELGAAILQVNKRTCTMAVMLWHMLMIVMVMMLVPMQGGSDATLLLECSRGGLHLCTQSTPYLLNRKCLELLDHPFSFMCCQEEGLKVARKNAAWMAKGVTALP